MESRVSGHWTDERLIEHLYGVGPLDNHLAGCSVCGARLLEMQASRQAAEDGTELSNDFLASQRRQIYAKLSEPKSWWTGAPLLRWASAAATVLILGSGIFVYEQNQPRQVPEMVTDAQLAQEVSQMADDSEPRLTAPLQALFVE